MSVEPFKVEIAPEVLDDLRQRLGQTRWPDEIENADWEYGTNLAYLQQLTEYWRTQFDWSAQQDKINGFDNFRAELDGYKLHFIHERGKGPNPLPLIITHGWPSSFYEMLEIIPRLTDPVKYGGKAEDSFDVVVPSVPGFGFSDRPSKPGMTNERMADMLVQLMTQELGYQSFAAQAGDIGGGITEQMALRHPDKLRGIYLTNVPYQHSFEPQQNLTKAEQEYMGKLEQWRMTEGAYAMIQASKPQTLAYGLNDSPIGLASWIIEKFRAWSDCDGDIEKSFSKDELLSNITIYWATQTINAANRYYYEAGHNTAQPASNKNRVPAAVGIFPKDIVPPPREWAERFFNLQRWTEMPRGGHFAASEEPDLLAEDIQTFFRPLR